MHGEGHLNTKAITLLVLLALALRGASAQGTIAGTGSIGGTGTIRTGGGPAAPLYAGNYTGSDVVQTPAAPFSTVTLANSCSRESILSNALICRMTDRADNAAVCPNGDFHATKSGGSTDRITNIGNGTWASLLQVTSNCGTNFVVEYDEQHLQRYPVPLTNNTKCDGQGGFDANNPAVYYCKPAINVVTPLGTANGSTVYKWVFAIDAVGNHCGLGIGNCYDATIAPTWSVLINLATCPQAPATAVQSYSQLGVGTDASVSNSLSWTGGQNTARYFFDQIPGTGCTTLDMIGDGTHPIWYPAGGGAPVTITSVNASLYIHDSYTVGAYAEISISSALGGCVGNDCPCIPTYCPNPANAADGPALWQVNTSNLQIEAKYPTPTGHGDLTNLSYYNANNPIPKGRRFSSLSAPYTLATFSCNPCEDNHFSADVLNDSLPIVGTRGGVANQTWQAGAPGSIPVMSEVYAIDSTGTGAVYRFCKTYSTGTTADNFDGQYAISGTSATRRSNLFTSDMLGNTGTCGSVNCSDVYAVGLVRQ